MFSSHFLNNSRFNHLHAAEYSELTWHLWYANGTAAAAVAPFSHSFDLNEVVFSSRDLKLHTGFIGRQHRSHAVPGLAINNLEAKVVAHVVCWKHSSWAVCEMWCLSFLLVSIGLLILKCRWVAYHKWRGFYKQGLQHLLHDLVEPLIQCCIGWKKLNFSSFVTVFILSTGTDLLILEGQTGPAHNNTGVARSIFRLQWETHLYGMTVAEGLIVPRVLELLLSLWKTHLVSCHLRLILHRLDAFPIQRDFRVCQLPLNIPWRPVWSCKISNYENGCTINGQ